MKKFTIFELHPAETNVGKKPEECLYYLIIHEDGKYSQCGPDPLDILINRINEMINQDHFEKFMAWRSNEKAA